MATHSFKQLEGETPEPATTGLAKPETALAKPAAHLEAPEGVEGEVDYSDIQLPRINLVQKMSDLVDAGFKAGDLVYNKELLLPQPVEVVVTRVRKQYQQSLPYGSEDTPDTCDTLEEVKARGGSTEFGDENHYAPVAHMQLLVAKPADCPEELAELFAYTAEGKDWAPAMLTVKSSSYTSAAKPVFTAAFNVLRSGLAKGKWHLTSVQKSSPKGTWHVPVMKLAGSSGKVAEIAGLVA